MPILYARSHLARKPEYRLLTRFIKSDRTITVVKSPIGDEAKPHVLSIIENEQKIHKLYNKILNVLFGELKKESVVYPYLGEPSLELQMEQALIQKNFAELHHLFQKGLSVINQLPTQIFDSHPQPKEYRRWFGQDPDLSLPMVELGLIDLTPGNLLATSGKYTLLDCEWVVHFPIEREFIAFRYLWSMVTHFSSLFKLYAKHFDLYVIGNPDFVVPKSWLSAVIGDASTKTLNRYLNKEAAFQAFVLDFNKQVVPTQVKLMTYEQSINMQLALPPQSETVIQARIQQIQNEAVQEQAEIARTRMVKLREELEKKEAVIVDLQHQLFVIHHSKWWKMFFFIKHPIVFARKFKHRIKMLKIRAASKVRRIIRGAEPVSTVPVIDLTTLKFEDQPALPLIKPQPIDIIIPVYNAGAEVRCCIESVLKHSPKNVHLYLIDDISTDPVLLELYKEIEHHPQVTLHRNPQRQGFVKNINTGFELSKNDVIILNTDTEVTENWVMKLHATAYAEPNVATVTPMTNNGEILSVPEFLKPNTLEPHVPLADYNCFAEQFSAHQRIEVPTGIGFCMYIKRQVIEMIGGFDAETYGMGYGEENDFCQRTIQAGFINIVDDSTFIYHRGTSSFTSEEKQAYIKKNLSLLFAKFPTYEKQVHEFIGRNPLKYLQEMYKLALTEQYLFSEPAVLFIVHKNPYKVVGGVEVDVRTMLEKIGPTPLFFVLHRDDNLQENCLYLKVVKDGKVVREFTFNFEKPCSFLDIEHKEITWFWQWLMKAFPNIHTVHLEHTYALPLAGLRVFSESGKQVLLNFHDFYYACPYEKLINKSVTEYVELKKNIDECYETLINTFGSEEAAKQYREKRTQVVTELFEDHISTFIFNSEYTLEEHKKLWPKMFTKKNSVVIEPYA
jgi:GT2 family glycosyltransferase